MLKIDINNFDRHRRMLGGSLLPRCSPGLRKRRRRLHLRLWRWLRNDSHRNVHRFVEDGLYVRSYIYEMYFTGVLQLVNMHIVLWKNVLRFISVSHMCPKCHRCILRQLFMRVPVTHVCCKVNIHVTMCTFLSLLVKMCHMLQTCAIFHTWMFVLITFV